MSMRTSLMRKRLEPDGRLGGSLDRHPPFLMVLHGPHFCSMIVFQMGKFMTVRRISCQRI